MNRTLKDSLAAGRNMPTKTRHRRGPSLTGMSKETDENLDLFSRNRRSLSVVSSDETDVSMKLGRLSVGSAKLACSGMDDLLSSEDGGKHDYDWLLTPPGTPLFPLSDGSESQSPSAAPRSHSLVRSISTNKASKLSVSQSESNRPSRPIRSSSVTRPSVSTSQYSTYSNKSTSILNTSSGSVSSYIRPSSPATRSSISSSTARPSTPSSRSSVSSSATTPPTPSARPVTSRSLTSSKARPPPTTSSIDRTRPSLNSRPSTPNSRPSTPNSRSSIPANSNSPAIRSSSRPSMPTRQNAPSLSLSTAPLSSETGLSTTVGQVPSKGRNAVTLSRPSSPSPRVRPPPQPLILPDFSLETPTNLRTTLPDRPLSAGRSRPGVAVAVKGNVETPTPTNVPRRPSPLVSRGRLTEPPVRGRVHPISQAVDTMQSRKASHVPELSTRRPIKSSATSTESSGFGRNISKKSLDMAIRHMDIRRNGTSGIRLLSGTTRFPQSIRSCNPKPQTASSAPASVNGNNLHDVRNNGFILQNGNYMNSRGGMNQENYDELEVDIYGSSPRYDTILFKEDLNNTTWLHSFDAKSDQEPIFDSGFEPLLPEPFDPL